MTAFRRRAFLALPLAAYLAGCGGDDEEQRPRTTAERLAPTPSCDDGDEPTAEQTEGPYFTPGSPERRTIVPSGASGTLLALSGRVVDTSCRPVRRALLDFWQADDGGEYDNAGFDFRGHQFTDARGRYSLETLVPGLYPGRTRHVHVKVQAPDRDVLTTQLYFPGEAANDSDGIFVPELVMAVRTSGERRLASFDFVLDV
jgi:protocatechuate 3,4-dioxygenase beta subunit